MQRVVHPLVRTRVVRVAGQLHSGSRGDVGQGRAGPKALLHDRCPPDHSVAGAQAMIHPLDAKSAASPIML